MHIPMLRSASWGASLLVGLLLATTPALARPAHSKLDPILQGRVSQPAGHSRVIVRTKSATGSDTVKRAGGAALGRFVQLGATLAVVPDAALERLAADADVISVHADRPLVGAQLRAQAAAGEAALAFLVPTRDWNGAGIGVAIIDSGIAVHDDFSLHTRGGGSRVIHRADFAGTDGFDPHGHGTHVAGIVAGNGRHSDGEYAGVAPGADLVSLKVLDASGRGTISSAIAAIEYAIAHRTRLRIRVLNLSVGAAVTESFETDPFTLAARRAVESGSWSSPPPATSAAPRAASRSTAASPLRATPLGADGRRLESQGHGRPHRRRGGRVQFARPDGGRLPGESPISSPPAPASSRWLSPAARSRRSSRPPRRHPQRAAVHRAQRHEHGRTRRERHRRADAAGEPLR
jgi:hypothetical protein